MKNKKLMALLSSLACIAVCFVLLFSACTESKIEKNPKDPSETEEVTEAEETEGKGKNPEKTEPIETEPEATEPEATEPTETEPEATEPTETEPEETAPSGGSTGSNMNTGTGGGYNPGSSEPTEPEATEPPEIVVPAAGSETNAYTEQIPNTSGSFKTVKIPAGEAMYYKLKTPGTYLLIESNDVSVVYDGQTYNPENGLLKLELPADGSQYVSLQFVNNGAEETAFSVGIQDAVGTVDNPVELTAITEFSVNLAEGDQDGVFHQWIADMSGEMKLSITGISPETAAADMIVTVNGQTYKLSDGALNVPVKTGDEVQIQVLAVADGEGAYPAATVTAGGYVVQSATVNVSQLPMETDSVVIPAGNSAYYTVSGAKNKTLTIADADAVIVYNGERYTADANGLVLLMLTDSPAALEICNTSNAEESYKLSFNHPVGHQKNPHSVTTLGELAVVTRAGETGYYYTYTAPASGLVSFQIWTYPETDYSKLDIVLTNTTSGEAAALWSTDENGDPLENYIASVFVKAGDVLTIQAYALNAAGRNVAAEFVIYGELYGSAEMPINIQYPGFTAQVPAGETLYYAGYNLSGLIFNMEAEGVKVSHNGTDYTPADGSISFSLVAEGRNPALVAITNTGNEDAVFEATFAYPVGHMENPDELQLGTNTVTQAAGAADYYYSFTAVRAGTLTFTFDPSTQWVYAVDNLTQGIYGDTQWSDSDPLVAETVISVAKDDVIRIRVNTYDTANMFETPAGTVAFTVKYVTGPNAITSLTVGTNTNLIPGEYAAYSGQFYDHVLYISNGKGLIVNVNGVDYLPDAKGEINVAFPDSDGSGAQDDLTFTVYNAGTANIVRTMMFSGKEVGSKENPEVIQMGKHTFTQTQGEGADHYYVFNATASGNLTITITSTHTNWVYQVTNLTTGRTSQLQLGGFGGQKTFRIAIRPGQTVEILINTFDPKTGQSIEGTVEFNVTM